jgi:hypothetical protein
MAPAAITGTLTASTICGTSANVPTWGDVLGEEHAAVAAGLVALRDHSIGAVLLEPHRLGGNRGRAQHDRPRSLDPLEKRSIGQAEMEAHDLGLELFDHLAERGVERRAAARRHRCRRIDAQFLVIGLEPVAPARFPRIVGHRRRVTEEIQVDRLVGHGADFRELLAQRLRGEHRARQRAEAARRAYRRHQLMIHGARHRREHDRVLDADELRQTCIGPHGPLLRGALPIQLGGTPCAVNVANRRAAAEAL